MALGDNIVAAYNLDESSGNASDSSPSGFTLTNTNTVGYASGLINNCADFGTANTNKSLAYSGAVGVGGNTTISLWVKMRTEIGSGSQTLLQVSDSTAFINYRIDYEYNGGTRRLKVDRTRGGISFGSFYYTVTLGTSNWYNIIVEYDGTDCRLYVDDTLQSTLSENGSGSSGPVVDKISLGHGYDYTNGTNNNYSSVYIDIAHVWSRALTSDERTRVYNSGSGKQYPFDYTISADTGVFTLTGNDVSFLRNYIINLEAGVFELTGIDVGLSKAYSMIAETGSFILSGADAILRFMGWSYNNKSSTLWGTENKSSSSWTFRNKN